MDNHTKSTDTFEADVDVEYRHGQKKMVLLYRHDNQSWRVISLLPSEWLRVIDTLTNHMDEFTGKCSVCGNELEAVRPGKYQCNYCDAAASAGAN